jgi:hypothetical protein
MDLRLLLLAGVGAFLAQEGQKPPAPAAAAKLDFEAATVGEAPKGFTVTSTIPDPTLEATPAKWEVAEDPKAPSGKRVLKLADSVNSGQVYNLLLRDEAAPADVVLTVKLRADSGGEDRGGGLVWRAKDASNYYVCRWNPLEKNLRCYKVEAGKRVTLQSAEITADADAWHTLTMTMKGRVIEISFDGTKQISCADATFAEAGKIGLWTKADACTSFDDLEVVEAKSAP